jgi:N-acylglucosamine 2-epimerase
VTSETALRVTLQGWRDRIEAELLERVVQFWLEHSLDRRRGGYHDHLDRDGKPFDSKKHVGLQAQALWMWARLCSDVDKRPEWIEAARLGAGFLRERAWAPDGRSWGTIAADGSPFAIERRPRNALFVAAALAEYARGCDRSAAEDARRALDAGLVLAREPERDQPPGVPRVSDLDTVTLVLDALESFERLQAGSAAGQASDWLARASLHVRPELDLVLEHVALDGPSPGAVLDGPEGRLVCPGRALLAAQQLFEHSAGTGDPRALSESLAAIESALDFGWDPDDGGLYLYLDRDGYSPVQIEWSRKLAWVHGVALVATLTAYNATRTPHWLERFEQVADYTFAHFPDPVHGEWFASLDRRNRVSQRFKAGPRKGGWAVARALLGCRRLLGKLLGAPALS